MKSPFSECNKCPLKNQHLVIGDCLNSRNLEDIKILFLAEAPALEEYKQGIPLVGRAGKVFREAIEETKLNTIPSIITNACLCTNLNEEGKTFNPPKEAVDFCKINYDKLIDQLPNLKYIISFGNIPLYSLGVTKDIGGIVKLRGKFYNYKNNIKILPVFHPSYVLRNGGLNSEVGTIFKDDLKIVYNLLLKGVNTMEERIQQNAKVCKVKKPYSFTIDEQFYSDDLYLFNVQQNWNEHFILYTFIDKDGNKKFYKTSTDENYFYTSDEPMGDADCIKDINDVKLCLNDNPKKYKNALFENDVRLALKHTIDYNLKKKESFKPKLKIHYFDIELYNEGSKAFPNVTRAERPVNSISFKDGDKTNVYLLKLKEMDDSQLTYDENLVNVTIFDDEKTLLESYFKYVSSSGCHIITGWNISGFDIPYLYNRSQVLGIDINIYSPIGIVDPGRMIEKDFTIFGIAVVDLLYLYKTFTYSVKESYKLGYICESELGKGKVAYEGTLDTLYESDICRFVEYSYIDTLRLEELDNKMKHVDLMMEIIKICSSTWEYSRSSTGLIDPLIISYVKNKNCVCRGLIKSSKDDKFEGAFVNEPRSGLFEYVVDLDFSSLYPSIIVSCNIDPNTYIAKIDENLARRYIYNQNMPDEFDIVLNPTKENLSQVHKINKEKLTNYIKRNDAIICINGTIFYGHEKKNGMIPEILRYIWDSRKRYQADRKKAEFGTDEYDLANSRQLVYKILMNSIYGVLGNQYYRFFNLTLAETITLTGQEANRFSQYHAGHFLKSNSTNLNLLYDEEVSNKNVPYVIYGDTDSIFLDMKSYMLDKEIIKDINDDENNVEVLLKECRKVESILNDNLLNEFCKLHNINPKYSKFNLKQEKVAKRALFFSVKKRYVLYVINDNGKIVDEMDYTGVVTKRSDYASYTKDCIKELMPMILKTNIIDFNIINKFINDKRKELLELINNGDKRIARPVNYTKDIKEYKTISSHILGMELWNDLEYRYFQEGTKGYQFKIHGIDDFKAPKEMLDKRHFITKKHNNIAIPFEEEYLPDYYVINKEAQIKFCWDDRIAEILNPISEKITVDNLKRKEKILTW